MCFEKTQKGNSRQPKKYEELLFLNQCLQRFFALGRPCRGWIKLFLGYSTEVVLVNHFYMWNTGLEIGL